MSFRGQKGKDASRKVSGFNRASAVILSSSDSNDDMVFLGISPVSCSSPDEAFPAISVKAPNICASRHQKSTTQTSPKEVGSQKTDVGTSVRENSFLQSVTTSDGCNSPSKRPSPYLEKKTKVLKHSPVSHETMPVFQSKRQGSSSLSSKLFQKDPFESGASSLWNEFSGSKISIGGMSKAVPKPPPKGIREVNTSKAYVKRDIHSPSGLFANLVKPRLSRSHSLPHAPTNSSSFHSHPLGNGGVGTSRVRKISSSRSCSSVNSGGGVKKERGANFGGKRAKKGACNLPSHGTGSTSVKGGQATDKEKILNRIHQVKWEKCAPVAERQSEKRKEVKGVGRSSSISVVSQKAKSSPSIPTSPKAGNKIPQSGSAPLYNDQSHRPLKASFYIPEPPAVITDGLGTSTQSLPTNKSHSHSVGSSKKVAHLVKSHQSQRPPAQPLSTEEKHKKRKYSITPASLDSNANLRDRVSSSTGVKKYKLKRDVHEKPKHCVPAEGVSATSACIMLAGKSKASTPLHKMTKPTNSASSGKAAIAFPSSSSSATGAVKPASSNSCAGVPSRNLSSSTPSSANSKPTMSIETTGTASSAASSSVFVGKPAITVTATVAEIECRDAALASVSTLTRKGKEIAEINNNSPFEFSEDDYFEILDSVDSVDSESLCSGYDCSDVESATPGSNWSSNRASLGATHLHVPSNLVKSSPHHQQISASSSPIYRSHSTQRSTYPLQRRQLARKSTAKRGIHYKHPKPGLMRMKKHCMLELKRVKFVNSALTKQEGGVLLSNIGEKKDKAKRVKPPGEVPSGKKRKHVSFDSLGTLIKRQKQSPLHSKDKCPSLDSVGSGKHQVSANAAPSHSLEHSLEEPLSVQTPHLLQSTTQSSDRHPSTKSFQIPPAQGEALPTSSTFTDSSDHQTTTSLASDVDKTLSYTSAKLSSTESNSPSSKKSPSLKPPCLNSSGRAHSTSDILQSPPLGGTVVKTEIYTREVHSSQSEVRGRDGERGEKWSQRDEMYDMRLQETILKLALEGNGAGTAGDKRYVRECSRYGRGGGWRRWKRRECGRKSKQSSFVCSLSL